MDRTGLVSKTRGFPGQDWVREGRSGRTKRDEAAASGSWRRLPNRSPQSWAEKGRKDFTHRVSVSGFQKRAWIPRGEGREIIRQAAGWKLSQCFAWSLASLSHTAQRRMRPTPEIPVATGV